MSYMKTHSLKFLVPMVVLLSMLFVQPVLFSNESVGAQQQMVIAGHGGHGGGHGGHHGGWGHHDGWGHRGDWDRGWDGGWGGGYYYNASPYYYNYPGDGYYYYDSPYYYDGGNGLYLQFGF